MKKLLLTLIVSIAFCGSIFAQVHSDIWETYWSDFNSGPFEMPDGIVAFVQIDGEYVSFDANWEDLEVGAFVNGECRGHSFLLDDDEHPYTEISVYRMLNETGGEITFQLYDHGTETLYEDCVSNQPIIQGDMHIEIYLGDYDNAVVLNFSLGEEEGYELPILGYGEGNGGWYLISSPIQGSILPTAVDNMISEHYDLYSFDQTGDNDGNDWINYKANTEDFSLTEGQGYLYASQQDVTLIFHGDPIAGDAFDVELVTESGPFSGLNLVGNPFLEIATIDRPFYVMNEARTALMPSEGEIPAMNGVFVFSNGDETLTFTKAAGTSGPGAKRLVANLTNDRGLIDRAIVHFDECSQLPKFQMRGEHTQVYIPLDDNDYSVVRSEGIGELPVNFKAEAAGHYTLSFTSEDVNFGYLHLIDNMTGADVDLLANPAYSFDANTSDYTSRFKLVFATGNADDNFAFYSNGSFIISNEGEASLQVVDVTGRILSTETIDGCANVNVNAANGIYMIRLINGDNVKVQKVVVR